MYKLRNSRIALVGMLYKKTISMFLMPLVIIAVMTSPTRKGTARALPAVLPESAVLDEWGNRFTLLGTFVPENLLRTQVRTTIAQLAMFEPSTRYSTDLIDPSLPSLHRLQVHRRKLRRLLQRTSLP
jgi:hypothetical protein